MPRIKQTPSKHATYVMKKVKKAAAKMKEIKKNGSTLIHTGKVKVPFKAAGGSGGSLKNAKDCLLRQLKRRWRSGTVAKREIRKLTRTAHLLLPRRPFQRLAREIAQGMSAEIRFTPSSLEALQHCSEFYLNEFLHNANLARCHAKRETLERDDMRFARFMTPSSMWVTPDRIWEEETFKATQETRVDNKVKNKVAGKEPKPGAGKNPEEKKKKKKKTNNTPRGVNPGSNSEKKAAAADDDDGEAPPVEDATTKASADDAAPEGAGTGAKKASKPSKAPKAAAASAKQPPSPTGSGQVEEDNGGSSDSSSGDDEEMNESDHS